MTKYNVDIYLVGGLIRNKLWGLPSNDYDFCLIGEDSIKFCEDLGYQMVGKSFPVYFDSKTGAQFALARKEKLIANNKYELDLKNVKIDDDLLRRDFTINALAYKVNWNIKNNEFIFEEPNKEDIIYGFQNGNTITPNQNDNNIIFEQLKNKELQYVRDYSFIEDPLRILRGFRFCDKYGTHINKKTDILFKQMIKNNCFDNMEAKRIYLETKKSLDEGIGKEYINKFYEYDLQKLKEFSFLSEKNNSILIKFAEKNKNIDPLLDLTLFDIKMSLICNSFNSQTFVQKYSFNSAVANNISLNHKFISEFQNENLLKDIEKLITFISKYSINKYPDLISMICFYSYCIYQDEKKYEEDKKIINKVSDIINNIDFSQARQEKNPALYVKNLKITTVKKNI